MPDGTNMGHNAPDEMEIDYGQLQAEIDRLAGMQGAVSEATGALRSEIKQIIETRGYHKGALKMIRDIDAMSPTKRADFLRTFQPMFDAMLSGKWLDQQGDLFDGEGEE